MLVYNNKIIEIDWLSWLCALKNTPVVRGIELLFHAVLNGLETPQSIK